MSALNRMTRAYTTSNGYVVQKAPEGLREQLEAMGWDDSRPVDGCDSYVITQDCHWTEKYPRGTHNECFEKLLRIQSSSVSSALDEQGYYIIPATAWDAVVSDENTFRGKCRRVIEAMPDDYEMKAVWAESFKALVERNAGASSRDLNDLLSNMLVDDVVDQGLAVDMQIAIKQGRALKIEGAKDGFDYAVLAGVSFSYWPSISNQQVCWVVNAAGDKQPNPWNGSPVGVNTASLRELTADEREALLRPTVSVDAAASHAQPARRTPSDDAPSP